MKLLKICHKLFLKTISGYVSCKNVIYAIIKFKLTKLIIKNYKIFI